MTIKINGTNTTAQPSITGTDTDTGLVYGTGEVSVVTDGTERLKVDSSGNVGIGESSPNGTLHVKGVSPKIILEGTNGGGAYEHYLGTAGSVAQDFIIQAGFDTTLIRSDNLLFQNTAASTEYMRIDSSGNVGIGSSSPSRRLVVSTSASNRVVSVNHGNGDYSFVTYADQNTSDDGQVRTGCLGNNFSLVAGGAERMRIASSGQLNAFKNAGSSHFTFSCADTASSSAAFVLTQGATGIASGTNAFIIAFNGNVTNTNNSYGAISDIKLKENIVDAGSQWDDLKFLQVRKYNYKEETGHETHTQIGLVAQEVELVSPGLVTESPDRDEDNNDLGTVTKSVNYSVLYMKAVKALQEAMERIETLETQNASLEARLTALEGGEN